MMNFDKNRTAQTLRKFVPLAMFLSIGWLTAGSAFAQAQPRFGGPEISSSVRFSFDEISHDSFDRLLGRYVDCQGMVCYQAWRTRCGDVQALESYLHHLGQAAPSLPASRQAMMAFYINAYNALTIWGILHEYPVMSIQRIDGKRTSFAIFDDLQFWDGESYRSLNGIENDVLRPLGDPRIHFALVCAARGCPRLRNRAYTAESLEWQLDDNAREFFTSHARFHISRLSRTVHMSPILDWYRDDFGQTDHEVVATVFAFLPQRDQQWLSQNFNWEFKYLGYDWSLNAQCPTVGVKLAAVPYRAYSMLSPAFETMKKWMQGDAKPSELSCDSCDAQF